MLLLRRPGVTATWVELAAAMLQGTPRLTGAACAGRWELFDPRGVDVVQETVPEADARHAEALAICAACPALGACRAWVAESRPSQRPAGVVAGIPPPKRGGSRPTRKASQTTRKALP